VCLILSCEVFDYSHPNFYPLFPILLIFNGKMDKKNLNPPDTPSPPRQYRIWTSFGHPLPSFLEHGKHFGPHLEVRCPPLGYGMLFGPHLEARCLPSFLGYGTHKIEFGKSTWECPLAKLISNLSGYIEGIATRPTASNVKIQGPR